MMRLGLMDCRGAGRVGVGDFEEADKQTRPVVDLLQSLERCLAARLDGRQRLGQAIPLMFETNELGCGFGTGAHHAPR